jgi:hypothetical protein
MLYNKEDYTSFKMQFIDHLPNANNGILANFSDGVLSQQEYSPRMRLEGEFNSIQTEKEKSPLIDLAIKSKEFFDKETLKQILTTKLFQSDHNHMSLFQAINQATLDVNGLLKAYAVNFVENAHVRLNDYKVKILKNIKSFITVINYTDNSDLNSILFEFGNQLEADLKTEHDDVPMTGSLE